MSNFKFTQSEIPGVFFVDTVSHGDKRGFFMETYKESDFLAAGLNYKFVQDNQSGSVKGVLRGLHYQIHFPQAKLIRAVRGEVFDVAVDLRADSPFYGKWVGTVLSEENRRQMLIPRGFAHGYKVLSDWAEIAYKCDELYHPEDEGGIIYNDPAINVLWPETDTLILSEKDLKFKTLNQLLIKF